LWNITPADADRPRHESPVLVGAIAPAAGTDAKTQNLIDFACANFGTLGKLSPTKRVVHSLFCVTIATIRYI